MNKMRRAFFTALIPSISKYDCNSGGTVVKSVGAQMLASLLPVMLNDLMRKIRVEGKQPTTKTSPM